MILGLYSHLAAAGVAASVAFSGAWWLQDLRSKAREKDHVELHASQGRELHRMEQARSRNVLDAVNLSRASETKLRTESAAVRNDLVGLLNTRTSALSYARTSLDACTLAAATYDELFAASTARYSELAEKAQRHVIDIQTREIAWPK